jgi:Mitochondrial ribosomal protein L37
MYYIFILSTLDFLAPSILRLPPMRIGQPMLNIQIHKDLPDPILLKNEDYPDFIWDALKDTPKIERLEDHEIQTRNELRAMNHLKMKLNIFKARLEPVK